MGVMAPRKGHEVAKIKTFFHLQLLLERAKHISMKLCSVFEAQITLTVAVNVDVRETAQQGLLLWINDGLKSDNDCSVFL